MNELSAIRPTFFSIEAEQQLLGAILLNNDAFVRVGDFLSDEHFYDPVHARIYRICRDRIGKGHLVSPVTLKLTLEGDDGLKELGGPAYLVRMAGAAISASAVVEYAKTIVEAACRRALHGAAQEAGKALSMGADSLEVRSGLLGAIQRLPEGVGEASSQSLLKAVVAELERSVRAYRGEVSFLKTGLGPLDRIIKGLAPGDFCLVAGATSMGKTSVALEIARSVAASGKGVAFASLEMSEEELARRLAAQAGRVAYAGLRDPSGMEEGDFEKYIAGGQSISKLPIQIIPRRIRDSAALYSAAKRAQMALPSMDLLVVDYVQLMRASGKGRYEQMTEVSISLKQLAGLLSVPLIGLCQLSRDIGSRDDKRPMLSDIKETGQFENDADQAIFCHREGYWLERQGPKADKSGHVTDQAVIEWKADCAAVKNKLELIVRKNRHGPVATAEMGFHDATMRFWELGQAEA